MAAPDLNPEQRRAVLHVDGPLLIFAGAGSGKTRVIVHRIANLVASHGVAPHRILAVTFTNKAAAEMRDRLRGIVGDALAGELWVGTFHATCSKLLRRLLRQGQAKELGLPAEFVIYDDSDQRAVMNRVVKELGLDDRRYPPRALLDKIHQAKQEGLRAEEYAARGTREDAVQRAFFGYERYMQQAGAVDFDDLINHVVRLVEDPQSEAGHWLRSRYDHVLVDEFQDVNAVQYRLVRALAQRTKNLCVVGDDDQSIYRWRGADVRIVRGFRHDFSDATVVKLEQNYRSSGNIVRAALGVIQPSLEREPKELWTASDPGEPVRIVRCQHEHEEAAWAAEVIRASRHEGVDPTELAVFYRTHAQSRVLEEVFRTERIPYRIVGGLRFFDRAEVKDLLAYLRLLVRPESDVDLMRIINTPVRKIGATTVEKLLQFATRNEQPLLASLEGALTAGILGGAAQKAVARFWAQMQGWQTMAETALPSELLVTLLGETGYLASLRADNSTESEARELNLRELQQSLMDYEEEVGASGEQATLLGYLERTALASTADTEEGPKVSLMTVHAAKGLEFDTVVVTGLEEDLFPFKSMEERLNPWEAGSGSSGREEEERRLAYVALTRARRRLVLTYAERRSVFGQTRYNAPSRFLRNLPPEALDARSAKLLNAMGGGVATYDSAQHSGHAHSPAALSASAASSDYVVERDSEANASTGVGRRVMHAHFGGGKVIALDAGHDPVVTVRFDSGETKRIKARFLLAGDTESLDWG